MRMPMGWVLQVGGRARGLAGRALLMYGRAGRTAGVTVAGPTVRGRGSPVRGPMARARQEHGQGGPPGRPRAGAGLGRGLAGRALRMCGRASRTARLTVAGLPARGRVSPMRELTGVTRQ